MIALLLLKFALLSAVIVFAGTYLAKYGDEIADKSGLGGSLVGLILIAAATSLPVGHSNTTAPKGPPSRMVIRRKRGRAAGRGRRRDCPRRS